ncbi:UNVERIFIED_CONTAM: hypothetical protein FKN15_048060 [Acipenser sinensis]
MVEARMCTEGSALVSHSGPQCTLRAVLWGEICADSTGVFTGLQEGAAVIQQRPVSHGCDTGRSAFLDALDVREVLVERERTSGEEEAT